MVGVFGLSAPRLRKRKPKIINSRKSDVKGATRIKLPAMEGRSRRLGKRQRERIDRKIVGEPAESNQRVANRRIEQEPQTARSLHAICAEGHDHQRDAQNNLKRRANELGGVFHLTRIRRKFIIKGEHCFV